MLVPPNLHTLPDGASLSTTEGVIVDNYTAYHTIAEQLKELQDWVKEQTKVK